MKRPRSDPAKGTKLIKAYERDLKLLIKLYKEQVIKAFKYSYGERSLESKRYEPPVTISTAVKAARKGEPLPPNPYPETVTTSGRAINAKRLPTEAPPIEKIYEPPVTITTGKKGPIGEAIPTHGVVYQKPTPQTPEPLGITPKDPTLNEEVFFDSLQTIDKNVSKAAKETIKKHTKKAYSQGEAYAETHIKAGGVKETMGISFNLPVAQETLNHLERRQDVLFSGLSTEISKSIHTEVSNGVLAGESVYQIADRFDKVFEGQYYKAERIARTETMTSLNQGALDRYRSVGFTKVKWLAAEDERTCRRPIVFNGVTYAGCGGLDGKVFEIDNCPPIPFHPNCRCTIIPVSSREQGEPYLGRVLHEGKNAPRLAAEGDVWIVTE